VCGVEALVDASSSGFEDCPEADLDGTGIEFTGPATYSADGTYSVSMTMQGSMTMSMPAKCLKDADTGVQVTCEQLNAVFMQQLPAQADAPFTSVTCSGSGGCDCVIELVPRTTVETGTFVVSGNSVTTTSSQNEVTTDQFCVDAASLTLITAPQMVNGESVSANITLTK
jgi:hypothetical protein